MNEVTTKTTQAAGMPLSPIGHAKPEPTTHTASNGETRSIDTGAVLKDDRPYSAIFQAELSAGNLDQYINANQVNKHLQSLKGASAPCTYLVNDRAHKYYRENGKWLARSEEWLKANPYAPGTRTSAAAKGMLSDVEVTAIKEQLSALDLVPDAVKPTVQPIIDGLKAKLAAHETAVSWAALGAEKARARRAALTCTERFLKAIDKKGGDWNASLYGSLRLLGAMLPDDQVAACFADWPDATL